MSAQNSQNIETTNNFQSFNDENTLNALQVLIVRTNDFSANSKLGAKLYFSNLSILTNNNYSNYIQDESDLDLVMYIVKSANTESNENSQNSNQIQYGSNNIQDSIFSSQKVMIEITSSIFKKLVYLASISIPITFNSIIVEISENSTTSSNLLGNTGNLLNLNKKENTSSNSNFSLSTMKDLYDYLSSTANQPITTGDSSLFSEFFEGSLQNSQNLSSPFIIRVNSINDVSLCETFFENYLDFLTFKKNMKS